MFFPFISDAAAGFLNRKAKIAAEKYRRKIMENNRPGGGTDGADGRKRTCEKKESRQQSDAAGGQVGMTGEVSAERGQKPDRQGTDGEREKRRYVICGFAYQYKMRCLLILTGIASAFCLTVFALSGDRTLLIRAGSILGILMLAEAILMIRAGKGRGIIEYSPAELNLFGFSDSSPRYYTTAQIREAEKRAGILRLKVGNRPENLIITAESIGQEEFIRFLSERYLL